MTKLINLFAAAVIALMPAAAAAQDKNDVVLDTNPVQETASPALPDSITQKIKDYEQNIKELTDERDAAQRMYDRCIVEKTQKEAENYQLTRQLKEAEQDKLDLLRKLVVTASNFIYAPYDKYLVDIIAIPAYKATEGTEVYENNHERLVLLQKYRSDVKAITDILADKYLVKDICPPIPTDKQRQLVGELSSALKTSDTYKRYKEYDDDDTYLMKIMNKILHILNNPDKFADRRLKDIRTELEGLLKDQ